MAVSRRTLLTGVGVAATGLTASAGQACSLVATVLPIGFSDAECRRSLRRLIELINEAPKLADDELVRRAEQLSVRFDEGVSDPILDYPKTNPVEDRDLYRAWSISSGKQDRSPIALVDVNLLKRQKGSAIYQFTLSRDQFHGEVTEEEAAGDSCGVASEAYYGREVSSYLGFFRNNKLRDVWAFDVWLRTQ